MQHQLQEAHTLKKFFYLFGFEYCGHNITCDLNVVVTIFKYHTKSISTVQRDGRGGIIEREIGECEREMKRDVGEGWGRGDWKEGWGKEAISGTGYNPKAYSLNHQSHSPLSSIINMQWRIQDL